MGSNKIYRNIINLLINILQNSKLKLKIIKDDEFYEHFLKLVNGLLFLEQDFNASYEDTRYARFFVQVLANLRDQEVKIIKDDNMTLEIVESDLNFLETYILNIFQISREDMKKRAEISEENVKDLSNIDIELENQLKAPVAPLVSGKIVNDRTAQRNNEISSEHAEQSLQVNRGHNNQNENNLKNLHLNLQGLKLPTHPASSQGFFPYTNKPKVMPTLKRILSIMFFIILIFVIALNIYGFVTTISIKYLLKDEVVTKTSNLPVGNIASNISTWNIIVEMLAYAFLGYIFFKKPPYLRDRYRMQPGLLIMAVILIMVVSIFGSFGFLSEGSYNQFFKNAFSNTTDPNNILKSIWEASNFQIYRILKLTLAGIAVIPILLIFVIFAINPRVDKEKVMQADLEYQKALQAMLKGETYEIDSSLYDQDLILEAEKNQENSKKSKI